MRHAHATHEIVTFLFRLRLYCSQDKTRQDVGCVFRSGNAEWREAMQRIVDRNDAKPARKRRPQMLCFRLRRVLLSVAMRFYQ